MKFCSACGATVALQIPPDDNRERFVCTSCRRVHYQNPRMVVGCLPYLGDRVLLARRAIEPRRGYWTLPAGFLENGESMGEGALRETREEVGASVRLERLYTTFSLPHISQIYAFYLAPMDHDGLSLGPESLDAQLFSETEIPWQALAFPVVGQTLRHFFNDRLRGYFPTRDEALAPGRRLLDQSS